MALNGNRILYTTSTRTPSIQIPPGRASFSSPASWAQSRPHQLLIVSAASKKVSSSSSSSRLGKFDSKNKRTSVSTKEEEEEEINGENARFQVTDEIDASGGNGVKLAVDYDDRFVMPKLPGEEPDFWEGPQWDGLGFFMQYMWAFGILFAIVSSLVAVAAYNEGATDFKDTPAYKESIQSQELLDEPDASSSDVFESNPTEAAPSLE